MSEARTLVSLNGADLSGEDPLRIPLAAETGLDYPPKDDPRYKVWRNFGRVFQASLIASERSGVLVPTDIAFGIADDQISEQGYFSLFCKRFRFPFPAFAGYDALAEPVFPAAALIKLLLARAKGGSNPASVSPEEVMQYLVLNNCRGTEAIDYYEQLKVSAEVPSKTETRQVREFMKFIGQFGWLRYQDERLWLLTDHDAPNQEAILRDFATPEVVSVPVDPDEAVLTLCSLNLAETLDGAGLTPTLEPPLDIEFAEGSREMRRHIQIERNRRVRGEVIKAHAGAFVCDMCDLDPGTMYPWTKNLLEVHHLLPLSSEVRSDGGTTRLSDLRLVCPTCHRAVHRFYRLWLQENGLKDFTDEGQAFDVYEDAKRNINNV